jgi:hypothetical protein
LDFNTNKKPEKMPVKSPEKPIFLRDEAEIKLPPKLSPAKPSPSQSKPLWLQEEPQ